MSASLQPLHDRDTNDDCGMTGGMDIHHVSIIHACCPLLTGVPHAWVLLVAQERCAGRAASLLRLLRWLHATRPGLLDGQALSAVKAAATGANPLNPAVEQLQLPQLAAMAAALLPWHVLVALLESGVSDARAALLRRVRTSCLLVAAVCSAALFACVFFRVGGGAGVM